MNVSAVPARMAGVSVLLYILARGSGLASAIQVPAMVKDVNPGAASSNPDKFLSLGNKLFFIANDGTTGIEPWVSDGTLGGTSLDGRDDSGVMAAAGVYTNRLETGDHTESRAMVLVK